MRTTPIRFLAAAGFFILMKPTLFAQFTVQQVMLEPGWNGVYLQVEPVASACADLIAQFPQIESIWAYDNHFAGEDKFEPIEFCEPGTPGCPLEEPPAPVKKRWHFYH